MERRQIAYFYNGILKAEETDLDLDGDMTVPTKGEVVLRPGGNRWKVVKVMTKQDAGNAFPIHMIYLKLAQ